MCPLRIPIVDSNIPLMLPPIMANDFNNNAINYGRQPTVCINLFGTISYSGIQWECVQY